MNVLFVKVPRRVWPFNGQGSAFWQPLGMLSMAGEIQRAHPDWTVRVVDCPGGRIGWTSLKRCIAADWRELALTGASLKGRSQRSRHAPAMPEVICLGEETVSADEAIAFARWIKQNAPQVIVIGGGIFFTYACDEALDNGFDVIVRGEGERAILELLEAIEDGCDFEHIAGLAFRRNGRTVTTPWRNPMADLDDLPIPAWDLVPMQMYGRGSKHHPGLVAVEHSRGCFDRCDFCALWRHMGYANNGTVTPWYRQKSPQRCFHEVDLLVRKYGRRTFGWVDPTFNGDPDWSDRFSELVLRAGHRITQTAWVRADGIVRDHKLGVLKKLVRAGLRQVMIGVERPEERQLVRMNKHNNTLEITREAFAILGEHYPDVFRIGSVIFGVWNESKASLDRLADLQYQFGMDYCFFIPLTPNPGTEVYRWARENDLIEVAERSLYNFHSPVLRTRRFSARQLEWLYWRLTTRPSLRRLGAWRTLFAQHGDARHRGVSRSLTRHGARIVFKAIISRLRNPFTAKPTNYWITPRWYYS